MPEFDRTELLRQVRQHLESLKAAGVEWLPVGAPLPTSPQFAAPAREPQVIHQPIAPARVEAPPSPQVAHQPAAPAREPQPALAPRTNDPTPAAPLTIEQRRHELHVLAERVAGCTRCAELASTRKQTVFGVGPLDADLCFVGEAPGFDEDRQGEPFVGPAGQLLNRIITACGLKREEVYICNILRCRPPGNRQPLPDEAANCKEYLERQLELIRPKFICALGAVAVKNLLGVTTGITRLRGSYLDYRGTPVLCTFHPSYLLRVPEAKRDVWEDMKSLLVRMGKPVPGRAGG